MAKAEVAELSAKHVDIAMNSALSDLVERGISKGSYNEDSGYAYRSIDEVFGAFGEVLATNELNLLPKVLSREVTVRECMVWNPQGRRMEPRRYYCTSLLVRYTFVSGRDGSEREVEVYGEAMDETDKGSNKAMSAAFKQMVFQTFSVPVVPYAGQPAAQNPNSLNPDADNVTPPPSVSEEPEKPVNLDLNEVAGIGVQLDEAEKETGGMADALAAEACKKLFVHRRGINEKHLQELGRRGLHIRSENVPEPMYDKFASMARAFVTENMVTQEEANVCLTRARSRLNLPLEG